MSPNPTSSDGVAGKSVSFQANEENFQPTYVTCTPRLKENSLKYRAPEARHDIGDSIAPPSSVARPNYDDSLRRVSVVVYQHVCRCEIRWRNGATFLTEPPPVSDKPPNALQIGNALLSGASTASLFDESRFVSPQFKYTFIRVPQVHPMTCYTMRQVEPKYHPPTVDVIYRFCRHLFNRAQLSAECSIVCLIYIERLMERANIPLLARNWKPIILCGLLLASKVWQDLSSWNAEFSMIYPQFNLSSINRLERLFLHHIEWDLYISGSVYAKYYFALRSMTEKKDFRRRYNYTMKVEPPNTKRLEERSQAVKNELYSRSL